ncbi:UvrD-helicase domain-containing protein [Streptomyces sp. NPDC046977]|uniref:UvrD-helicase domain-containing protein n=1 Tax=Streptomyces sp. NPDC046977 TaxID=3154703 RepID=UPI0033DA8EA8
MNPTTEQTTAIDTYGDGVDLVLQAGAGCGKSSTLEMTARSDSRRRMLYVAYNKSIASEAARSFPGNVTCKTGHGLAFAPCFLPRINRPRQTAKDAADALDVRAVLGILGAVPTIKNDMGMITPMVTKVIMRVALRTVERFCYSADPEITDHHVPHIDGLDKPETRGALLELVMPVAAAAWQDIISADGVLKYTHDYYLKRWALGRPRLPADVVLLDEAQDTNDVLSSVLLAQHHAQRIAVGDSAQQIYSWRGANDALSKFVQQLNAPELTLSQSFRFGPAIASQANLWLRLINAPLRLTGWDACDSSVGPVDAPDAVLCRTNAGAMGLLLEALDDGVKVAMVGGRDDLRRLAWAAEALQAGRPTDHPEFMAFPSWTAVREYANEEDNSLKVLVDLIDEHGTAAILSAADSLIDEKKADLVISTAHKAKGREWDYVRIHGDFKAPRPDAQTGHITLRREEARLAYVAVTRARRGLDADALSWVHTVNVVSD